MQEKPKLNTSGKTVLNVKSGASDIMENCPIGSQHEALMNRLPIMPDNRISCNAS